MPVDPKTIAKAREYIGHAGPVISTVVTQKDIRRFALSIGDTNPLFRDDDFAKANGYEGVIAPAMFHTVYSMPEDELDRLDEAGLGPNMGPRFEVPVPGFPGAVAGGRDIHFGDPIRPGDVISVQETVVDVYEKEGRMGPMIFVISEFTYKNQSGQVVVNDRQTLIRHR